MIRLSLYTETACTAYGQVTRMPSSTHEKQHTCRAREARRLQKSLQEALGSILYGLRGLSNERQQSDIAGANRWVFGRILCKGVTRGLIPEAGDRYSRR
jgi:hypothetical protein